MATSWRTTSAMRRSRTLPAAVSIAFFAASANESGLVPITSVTRYTLPATASPFGRGQDDSSRGRRLRQCRGAGREDAGDGAEVDAHDRAGPKRVERACSLGAQGRQPEQLVRAARRRGAERSPCIPLAQAPARR